MGGRFKREGTHIYLWLIHVDVWQKSTQYCKAIILHLKVNKLFKIIFTRPWWESKYRRKRVDRSCPREQLNFKVKERLKLPKAAGPALWAVCTAEKNQKLGGRRKGDPRDRETSKQLSEGSHTAQIHNWRTFSVMHGKCYRHWSCKNPNWSKM